VSLVELRLKHEPCQVNTVAETLTVVCLDRQMGHITPQVIQDVEKGCMTNVRLESTPFDQIMPFRLKDSSQAALKRLADTVVNELDVK
jgi:hypothetical protein